MLYLNNKVQGAAWPRATTADLILKEESVRKNPGFLPYGVTVMTTSRQYTVLGQMPRDGIFRFLKSTTEYIYI